MDDIERVKCMFVLTEKSPAGRWWLQYNSPTGPGPFRNVQCFKSPDMKKFLPRCFRTQLRAPSCSDFWEWVEEK